MTRSQQGAVAKIDNIVRNGAQEHDFAGVAKELRGEHTGYDHVTEMGNNVRGLCYALASIAGSLGNPTLAQDVRAELEAASLRGQVVLSRMRGVLAGRI